jgi:polyhydroxyalkanoate synthesis repressor PhaR
VSTNPVRLIKRYGNRKLYDTLDSRYITLDGIARLVRRGNDLRVVDNDTGEDLTTITFAQIILEEEKRRSSLLPLGVLRELIEHGEEALAQLRLQVDKGIEAIGTMGERAGRRVQEMVGRRGNSDKTHADEVAREIRPPAADAEIAKDIDTAGRGFFDELLAGPQRRLEAVQRSIDEQIKRITGHPTFQHEIRRIERSIKKIEERVARLRREEIDPPQGDDATR